MATITVFVQTTMPGLTYGDVVDLEHTDYIDTLIAGGRLVPASDPIFAAVCATTTDQPRSWDLLDTAAAAASPEEPVTPASAALNEPAPLPVDPTPPVVIDDSVEVTPAPVAAAPVDAAPVDVAPVEAAPVDAPVDAAPVDAPVDPAV